MHCKIFFFNVGNCALFASHQNRWTNRGSACTILLWKHCIALQNILLILYMTIETSNWLGIVHKIKFQITKFGIAFLSFTYFICQLIPRQKCHKMPFNLWASNCPEFNSYCMLYISTSIKVKLKNRFFAKFCNWFSCFFLKKHIWTSICSAHHTNAGQNMQHCVSQLDNHNTDQLKMCLVLLLRHIQIKSHQTCLVS